MTASFMRSGFLLQHGALAHPQVLAACPAHHHPRRASLPGRPPVPSTAHYAAASGPASAPTTSGGNSANSGQGSGNPRAGPAALLLHANAMVLDDMSDWAQYYLSLGVSVLIVTFWGYPDPEEAQQSDWAQQSQPHCPSQRPCGSAPVAAAGLGCCASSGCIRRLWAAQPSREARPGYRAPSHCHRALELAQPPPKSSIPPHYL